MELRHLRYFVAVAEERHFGRAAARLHMAQPPLSQQIRLLETELGVTLLTRSTRHVELTAAGTVFLERARAILDSLSAATQDTVRAAEGTIGRLAVGFTGSATYELMPLLARAVHKRLPGVLLEVRGELLTGRQVADLEAGRLDVGFLRPPVRTDLLDVTVIRAEPLVVALPDTHPLTRRTEVALTDLADEPFVSYLDQHRSVVHDSARQACRKAGFLPRVVQEVSETSTLVAAVAGGVGVALLPESARQLTIAGAEYRSLTGTDVTVQLAVAHRHEDDNPVVRRFLALLPSALGDIAPPALGHQTSQSAADPIFPTHRNVIDTHGTSDGSAGERCAGDGPPERRR
jgi:DNA-binding transcriptional LysR family regulator